MATFWRLASGLLALFSGCFSVWEDRASLFTQVEKRLNQCKESDHSAAEEYKPIKKPIFAISHSDSQ
jgi:hypothetical protein